METRIFNFIARVFFFITEYNHIYINIYVGKYTDVGDTDESQITTHRFIPIHETNST